MLNQSRSAIDGLLADSLKELSKTRPIEKITIREITDKAGVIRPTFYNHFQDKYELIEWIVDQELYEPIIPFFDEGKAEEGLVNALGAIEAEKSFYTRASLLEGQNSFEEILKNTIKKIVVHYINAEKMKSNLPYNWLTVDKIADAYAQAVGYAITRWIHDGMKVPKEELAKVTIFLLTHSAYDVVRGL